jgi:uncharacterized RDD family membrane protein YckC
MQTISVSTTQNVSIQYPLAGLGDRIFAYLLDQLIIVLYVIISLLAVFNLAQTTIWIYIVVIALPMILYPLFFEIVMNGQTPGKKAMNIQVIKLDGTEPGFGQYALRWVFGLLEFAFSSGVIPVLVIAAGGKGQRLGDVVAGTTVVKLIQEKEITSEQVFITPDANYKTTFPEAMQLNSRDIEVIQKAIEAKVNHGNERPLIMATEKIKTTLGIKSEMPPAEFLYTIVKDYNHLNSI